MNILKNPFRSTSNVDIAHGHRSYQKFIGRSASNLPRIAMVLSMVVVPLGLISLVWLIPELDVIVAIVASIVAVPTGVGLAYVIEGMTVQACNRWLNKSKELKALNEESYNLSDRLEEIQAQVEYAKGGSALLTFNNEIAKLKRQYNSIDRKIKSVKWNIGRNIIATLGTSSVSFAAGCILWHLLFGRIDPRIFPDVAKDAIEIALALLVPWVLIQSELGREETEKTIKESITSSHYLLEAQQQDMVEHAVRELTEHHKRSISNISEHNPVVEEVANIQAIKAYSMLALGEGKDRQFDLLMKEAENRKMNQLALEEAQSQKLLNSYIEGSVTNIPLTNDNQPSLRVLRSEGSITVAERNSKAKENRRIVESLCDKYGIEGVAKNMAMTINESGLKRATFYRIYKQVEEARSKDFSHGA